MGILKMGKSARSITTGEALQRLLLRHPKMLLYSLAPDGRVLHSGKARAQVGDSQDT